MAAKKLNQLLDIDEKPDDKELEFIINHTAKAAQQIVAQYSVEEITDRLEIIAQGKKIATEKGEPVFVTIVPIRKKNDSTDNR